MSDEAERIRRQMQDVRQEMGRDVHVVVERAKELSDWRYYVRTHPWACVGSALALGFLAVPGKRMPLAGADVQQAMQQLKQHGLNVATGGSATGSLLGRAAAIVGPIVLRNAVALIASQLRQPERPQASNASSPSEA